MKQIWKEMYEAARAVQHDREISERISAGCVAAAVESTSGNIFVGVCVDTSCSLGICAERNAIFHMITCGEYEIRRVLAVMPDGKTGAPCGACRELMAQMAPGRYQDIEIMLDYDAGKSVTLGEITPEWWL
jgi:cytidine deaminase